MQNFVNGKVENGMTRNVITVHPDMSIHDLELLFDEYQFNMFPVLENKELIGIVSQYDFLKAFIVFGTDLRNPRPYENIAQERTIRHIFSQLVTVRAWHPLTYVLELMAQSSIHSFPVVDDDKQLVGVISRRDLIRLLKSQ
ncbi:MAG: CBS domain-containing protein [SAR324 cluster bacterium]|nr:CBS domain-containing protein [SAR324 cluster bacterium]MBF0351851.1 CBS domain-containing protein [SAR324 cluster bacterium]